MHLPRGIQDELVVKFGFEMSWYRHTPLTSDATINIADDSGVMQYTLQGKALAGTFIDTYPAGLEIAGISADGRYAVGTLRNRAVCYDSQAKATVSIPGSVTLDKDATAVSPNGRYVMTGCRLVDLGKHGVARELDRRFNHYTFSHDGTRLAGISHFYNSQKQLIIYPLSGGVPQFVAIPGDVEDGNLAWSPHDDFIAYPGRVNPFNNDGWQTDIRIIDTQTGASATLTPHHLRTVNRTCRLAWLP
jgi:hypothetical protein